MKRPAGRSNPIGLSQDLWCVSCENLTQRPWPANEGDAGGLILSKAQKSAPGITLIGDKWRCEFASRKMQSPHNRRSEEQLWRTVKNQQTLMPSYPARAKRSAATLPAVEAGLSSAADCGKRDGDCLSEASSSQPPQTASSARNREAALTSARLFFASFLLAKQKKGSGRRAIPGQRAQPIPKVLRPPGRDPACRRPTASHAFLPTPQRKTP
jgi:hypothetical protein